MCRAYGRCHCRAGKKPAFWINLQVTIGTTGRSLGTAFIFSIRVVGPMQRSNFNGISRVCRRQINSLRSNSIGGIEHHVGEKLSLNRGTKPAALWADPALERAVGLWTSGR